MSGSVAGAVLGVSADYHDAAAALLVDGRLVAAAEEERFTRLKHDPSLPRHAIRWCLDDAGLSPGDLQGVCFYDKPFSSFERIVASAAAAGPRGVSTFTRALGTWAWSKLWAGYRIERALAQLGGGAPRVRFCEHHLSHAAAAFYPSPFDSAAILTVDGVGEWTTASIGRGAGRHIEVLRELRYPQSVGLFYSAMTAYCGFAVNDGEYKLMGLAPYGIPRYAEVLRREVIRVTDDGAATLDQRWFDYRAGRRMTRPRLATLLDGPPRRPDEPLTQREADLAASTQVILEEVLMAMARRAHELTGERRLCLAGGVAHNCVAVGRLLEAGPFEEVWVQPAAADSGSAVGAAAWLWHELLEAPRDDPNGRDGMSGAMLGPSYADCEVRAWLDGQQIPYEYATPEQIDATVATALAEGSVVGWFQGRMEFGPRALGNRSILADPRDPEMVQRINRLVKGREGFRPFAPSALVERAADWFEVDRPFPFMTVVVSVAADRWVDEGGAVTGSLAERLGAVRSEIPACTHVDRTARLQTVDPETHPRFHALLTAFESRTGCPVLLNTSFNRRDEPIVRTPADAYRCFVAAELDLLVIGNALIDRRATHARSVA